IDLHINVPRTEPEQLLHAPMGELSADIRKRVESARTKQRERFQAIRGVYTNAEMPTRLTERYCMLDAESQHLLTIAMQKLDMSARSYTRILKVSRTIADLEG